MSTFNQRLNKLFGRDHHNDPACTGSFEHRVEEVNLPLQRIASMAVCPVCRAAYYTPGFEHWLETYQAYKLLDKPEPLTDTELRFLRLHFQMVDAEASIRDSTPRQD